MTFWRICGIFYSCVAESLKKILKTPDVHKVVAFGSGVTDRCHAGSDVDVYADTPHGFVAIRKYLDFAYDLITDAIADKTLKEEICVCSI